ncbi:hypothetical protein BUW94_09655 [Corynebacterium diphtheriae]|nr:hypothetical protein BUW94_09655 [Corynebacterium diphtheriae]
MVFGLSGAQARPARGAFIDGLDGLGFDDDDISVRLHGRFLVLDGLDALIPTKLRTLVSCATPEPLGELISAF